MRSCSQFNAFMFRLSFFHYQTFVRSCSDFRAIMSSISCIHQTFVRSCSDFRAFMLRLSCFHVQTFVRSPDGRSFMFVRFSMFPGYVIMNAQRPTPPPYLSPRAWPPVLIFDLDILASV